MTLFEYYITLAFLILSIHGLLRLAKREKRILDKSKTQLRIDFEKSLIYLSKGGLNPNEVIELAEKYWHEVDWDNDFIGHKGVNWVAKAILKKEGLI